MQLALLFLFPNEKLDFRFPMYLSRQSFYVI